jgi:hypothetical protein
MFSPHALDERTASGKSVISPVRVYLSHARAHSLLVCETWLMAFAIKPEVSLNNLFYVEKKLA